MKDRTREWLEKRSIEKYLPAYQAFISVYPFGLKDLDGEIWADVEGYEGLYEISNFGRVKSFAKSRKGKILTPTFEKVGYSRVILSKDCIHQKYLIHRLVATAFVPNPENKEEVNHIDGNKLNNYFENLEWVTTSENQKHSLKIGIIKEGAEHRDAKFTKEQVRYIREVCKLKDPEYNAAALARKFNVGKTAVLNVFYGRTYKNVD